MLDAPRARTFSLKVSMADEILMFWYGSIRWAKRAVSQSQDKATNRHSAALLPWIERLQSFYAAEGRPVCWYWLNYMQIKDISGLWSWRFACMTKFKTTPTRRTFFSGQARISQQAKPSVSQSGQAIYSLRPSTLAQSQYGYHRSSRTPCLQLKKQ